MIRPVNEPWFDSREKWCFGITEHGNRKLFTGFTSKEGAARALALQHRQLEKMAPSYTKEELKSLGCDVAPPKGKIRRLSSGEAEDRDLTMDPKIIHVTVQT